MPPRKKTKQIEEFGDFQTPCSLARDACSVLSQLRAKPATIIEPTCGEGSFLLAALEAFSSAEQVLGRDINPAYVDAAARLLADHPQGGKAKVAQADFFSTDWASLLGTCAEPILVIGNPPWVTNSGLGVLGSSNLPEKSNFHRYAGLDAITGKSNFDISEWMLIQLLECLDGRRATLAMLCKTAVARKVLVTHGSANSILGVLLSTGLTPPNISMPLLMLACLCVSLPQVLAVWTAMSTANWPTLKGAGPLDITTDDCWQTLERMNGSSIYAAERFTGGVRASSTIAAALWSFAKKEDASSMPMEKSSRLRPSICIRC
ncbi:MAG: SAM-dependent DNA methyltransferase [Planctomycetaceae bacterium]|nr:SAM-dependent DNA methyltransferase [Planctomycetaceae bacterium]